MKYFKISILREYSIFIWLLLIAFLGIFMMSIYSSNKIEQNEKIKSIFENIYLKKTLIEISKNLKPRYTFLEYNSKAGDTYETIVNKLNVNKTEKKNY